MSNVSSYLNLQGTNIFNVGHTAGYGREDKNTVTGARIIDALNTVQNHVNIEEVFKYYDKTLAEYHTPYRVNVDRKIFNEIEGNISFIYTVPQAANINQHIIGPQERTLATNFAKGSKNLQTLIAENLLDVKQSPSLMDMLFNKFKNTFLGLKVVAQHYVYSKTGKIKQNVTGKATEHNLTKTVIKNNKLDLLKIRNLINLKLHDEIKRHMGDGRTREILNYRTGRFARSAEVENISQTREGYLQMTYSYMRYPYDVFLPGGYLYKPGRDPRGIIGPSIRQLASKYISNNFKVNPILRGDR